MEVWRTMAQIKPTVLEIVHEIPEVTKLLVSEENERSQVEEINQEEKNKLFFIKAGKGPDNIDGHTCKKNPQKSVALSRSTASDKFVIKLGHRDRFAPN